MFVYVVGVPGAGKTSVISEALKHLDTLDIRYANFGDYVLRIVREKYSITNRDEIRKRLTHDEYIEVQKLAAELLKKENEKYKLVLVDTHLIIETTYGYYSGIPKWISDILKPTAIVVVVAPPDQIYKRRVSDKTRERDIESVDLIKLQQELTKVHAVDLVYNYGCYLKIVENKDGELEKAGKELAEYLKLLLTL